MMVASDKKLQVALRSLHRIGPSKSQDRSRNLRIVASLGTDTMKALVHGLCLLGPACPFF
jgi:hypothetical protein